MEDSAKELLSHFLRLSNETTLEVAQVVWRGVTPSLEWETFRTWPAPPSPEELVAAQRDALEDTRYFQICRHCGERSNRGHMHDKKICQGCAQTHFGVVY